MVEKTEDKSLPKLKVLNSFTGEKVSFYNINWRVFRMNSFPPTQQK